MQPAAQSHQEDQIKDVDEEPVASGTRSRKSIRKKKLIDGSSARGKPSSATPTVKKLPFMLDSPVSHASGSSESENFAKLETITPRRSARLAKKTATPIAKPERVQVESSTPSTSSTITSSPGFFNQSPVPTEENTESISKEEISTLNQSETRSNWKTANTINCKPKYDIEAYTSQLVERVARKTNEEIKPINSRNARKERKPRYESSSSSVSVSSSTSRTISRDGNQAADGNKQNLQPMTRDKRIEGQPSSLPGRNFVLNPIDENINRSQLINIIRIFHQRIANLERIVDEKRIPSDDSNTGRRSASRNADFHKKSNESNHDKSAGDEEFDDPSSHDGRSSKHDKIGVEPRDHEHGNVPGQSSGYNPPNLTNNTRYLNQGNNADDQPYQYPQGNTELNQGNNAGDQPYQYLQENVASNQISSEILAGYEATEKMIDEVCAFRHAPPGTISFLLRTLQSSFLYRNERSHALLAANFIGLCTDAYSPLQTRIMCSTLGSAIGIAFSRDRLGKNLKMIVEKVLPSLTAGEDDDDAENVEKKKEMKKLLLVAMENADEIYLKELSTHLGHQTEKDLFNRMVEVAVLREGAEQCKKGRIEIEKASPKIRDIVTISVSKPRRTREYTEFKTSIFPDLLGKVIWRTKELFISNDHTAHFLYAIALIQNLALKLELNHFIVKRALESTLIKVVKLFVDCLKTYQRGKMSKTMLLDFVDGTWDSAVVDILNNVRNTNGIEISSRFLNGHSTDGMGPSLGENQIDHKLDEPLHKINDQESQPLNSKYGHKDFTPEFYSKKWFAEVTNVAAVRENFKREKAKQERDPHNEYPDNMKN